MVFNRLINQIRREFIVSNIHLVVAVSENGIIGTEGKLPWHLPEDLFLFKSLTKGNAVIMGRKTFESIGKPLPDRDNYVLTRDPSWKAKGVKVLNEPIIPEGHNKVFIVGGSEIYKLYEARISYAHVSTIGLHVKGDATFPFQIKQPDWFTEKYDQIPTKSGVPLTYRVWRRNAKKD